MQQRIVDNGFTDATAECADLMRELRRMERSEMVNAIGGEGYRTLWPASRS